MNSSGQSPPKKIRVQTIGQLAQLCEARFKQLRTMIAGANGQQTSGNGQPPDAAAGDHDSLQKLIDALQSIIGCLATQLARPVRSGLCDEEVLQDFARALALSGNGQKFELTVESVIRNYCDARLDVQRYSGHSELPSETRDDVVAGFTRVMEQHRRELRLLGVEMEEVSQGTEFDPRIHEAVKHVNCPHPERENTVHDCISPLFRWKNGEGQLRFKPAKVTVYIHRSQAGNHSVGS